MARARVNLALLMLTVLGGCRLGRPPPAGAFSVGRVHVAVPEPALGDALSSGLAAALSRQGALGAGPTISLRVLGAAELIQAASGNARIHAVDLRLEVTVTGPRPRSLVWTGTREYGSGGVDPLADTHARAEAWRRLSARAGDEIAAWLLHAPPERP